MPKKPWTEEDYRAAGVVQCKLRLKADDLENLRTLAHESGIGLSDWVTKAVRQEWKKRGRKKTT